MEPLTLKVITPGATLAVRVYVGDSDPIFLLHGGPGGYDYLGPVAVMLSFRHHVVSYDQRGGGLSSRHGPYRIEDHINDLEILRQHIGVQRIHLFGHSWGGLLVQLYAHARPERIASMVLCNSSAGVGRGYIQENQRILRTVTWKNPLLVPALNFGARMSMFGLDIGFRQSSKLLAPLYFFQPQKVAKDDLEILSRFEYSCFTGTTNSIKRTHRNLLKKLASSINVPVLLLYGKHDLLRDSAALLYKRFPGSQEIWFEYSGHFPWIEEPERFREVLTTFYKSVAPPFD